MRRILLFSIMLLSAVFIYAQRTISGKITDGDTGEGLPGVTIQIKGTTTGASTDINGDFSLSASADDVLVVSYVGYASQEITVGSRTTIDLTISADTELLEEVVVVGYGTQDKKEITSAVTTVGQDAFNQGNVNDAASLIQGKVAGVSINNRGGDPNGTPTIRLRGLNTLGPNQEPLIVIDGVIGSSLQNIDPNDIETFTVLKDGSAAAIYGSRASSGVVLITTKSGSTSSKPVVNYNGFFASSAIARSVDVMSSAEYTEAGGNDLGSNTDWIDEVTRTGYTQVHNLSVAGGGSSTTYRVSANFRDVDGILENSGFEQLNLRTNLSQRLFNDKLKLTFNSSYTTRESNFSYNEALRYAALYNPTAPIFNDDGTYFQAVLFDNFNPVAIIEQNQNLGERRNFNFNLQADLEVTEGLVITTNIAQQYNNQFNGEYYPSASFFRGLNRNGLARRFSENTEFTLFEAYASYNKTFGKLDATITAGYSYQKDFLENLFIEAGNFPNDDLGYHALENSYATISAAGNLALNSGFEQSEIQATFGRLNLNYDNKVFLNGTVRREGSTRFGPENRYGTFYAIGLGTEITELVSIPKVNSLKLRGGYGLTGANAPQTGLSQDGFARQNDGSFTRIRLANPNLKWEEKEELNVGMDFAALDNKLTGSVEYYDRTINDFIIQVQLDASQGQTGDQWQNAGQLSTTGFEASLNYQVDFGEVQWNPGVVFTTYETILDEFVSEEITRANLGAPGQNDTQIIRVAVGESIGQLWGPVFNGADENGNATFVDLNRDGQIIADAANALNPDADFTNLGNGIPDFELGWTNTVTYKNWDFNLFFRGSFGHSLVNTFRLFYEPIDPGAINSYNRVKTELQIPELIETQWSSLYVEKADFVRLDNVTVGYSFNTELFSKVRAYFTVNNAFTITDYTGVDPEANLLDQGALDNGAFFDPANLDPLSPGIDRRNNYFLARTFTLGVNLTLK